MPEIDKSQDDNLGVTVELETGDEHPQLELLMRRADQAGLASSGLDIHYDKSMFGSLANLLG